MERDMDPEQESEFILDGTVVDDLDGEGMGVDSDDDGEEDEGAAYEDEDDSFHCFTGHTDAVLTVAWNPTVPGVVASGGMDDVAYMWKVGIQDMSSEEIDGTTFTLTGHSDSVATVSFSNDGTLLASGSLDGTVKVWRVSDGHLVQSLEGPGAGVEWVCWHPKGNVVLAGSEDFSVWMWLAQTGACMQVMTGHTGSVTAGSFTPDGKHIVTIGGENDCSLRVWNPKTGECLSTLQRHPFHICEEGLTSLAIHQDSVVVLTGAADGSLRLSNIHTNRVLTALQGHESSVEAVGFAPRMPVAATADVDGRMLIWDLTSNAQRGVCEHNAGVSRLAWHQTEPLLYSACMDGIARVWDLRTAQCVRQWVGHKDAIQDICLSPDASMLLTASDDCTARVFNTA